MEEQVVALFKSLIKSWEHISSARYGEIKFDKGLRITLIEDNGIEPKSIEPLTIKDLVTNWCDIRFPKEGNSSTMYRFNLVTPNRVYHLPRFNRKEYAEIMDTIEDSIQKFEQRKLNGYLDFYSQNITIDEEL